MSQTSKEQAKELINKYYEIVDTWEQAKALAIISCDLIIQDYDQGSRYTSNYQRYLHWKDVKRSILE